MLNEMAHVGQAKEGLLDRDLVIFNFALACTRVLRGVLLVELELGNCLGNNLLQRREQTLLNNDLSVLGLVDQVGLDEEVPHCVDSNQIHLVLKLVSEFHHTRNCP